MVSGLRASAAARRIAASSARSGRPVWSPTAEAAAAPQALPISSAVGEVRTVEPRRDEPGTERVAGADRVDDDGERDGGPDDRLVGRVAVDRDGAHRAQLDDGDRRPEIERRPVPARPGRGRR